MISFLSILAIGFFLGMRHATDPDHVIAVTTIVSRQSKISRAALTGVFWGVGHTLTIVAVGTAIILFGVVIPARIGLSMEFSVALMLIVLSIASAFTFFGREHANFSARLGLASGLLSLAFGLLLVYQIGFAGGLFSGHAQWTPH